MGKLEEIVGKIFKARDFEISKVSDEYFLAMRGDIKIAVICKESNIPITDSQVKTFLESVDDTVDRRIFVTDNRFKDNVYEISETEEILFWDKEKLEKEIGKAVLLKDFDFFIKPKEIVEEKVPLETFDGEILKPNITREKAEKISKKFIHPISFELNLVPYYIYDYQCEFLIAENSIEKTAGTIGINGITKYGELWFNYDFIQNLEIQHKKINPLYTLDQYSKFARTQIIELNTRSIETTRDSDSVIIVEKKKLKPKQENIKTQPRGMLYLPVWVVGGHNGKAVIDAVSGDVNEKKLFEIT